MPLNVAQSSDLLVLQRLAAAALSAISRICTIIFPQCNEVGENEWQDLPCPFTECVVWWDNISMSFWSGRGGSTSPSATAVLYSTNRYFLHKATACRTWDTHHYSSVPVQVQKTVGDWCHATGYCLDVAIGWRQVSEDLEAGSNLGRLLETSAVLLSC